MISTRPIGRDQQLIERALLPFPRHRHRRQQQRLQHRQRADQRRYHVPPRLQIRIEPRAHDQPRRRRPPAMRAAPIGIELLHHRAHITQRRRGRVRIASVGDHLHFGRHARQQSALELLIDLQHQQRLALVDVRLQILGPVQIRHAAKHFRAVQSGQQFPRSGAVVLIQHGVRHVVQVVRGRVSEHQALKNRRNEQHRPPARILQHRQQFLAGQSQNSQQRVEHHRTLRPTVCGSPRASGKSSRRPSRPAPRCWARSRPTRSLPKTMSATAPRNTAPAAHR